jgi:hypothetical protein
MKQIAPTRINAALPRLLFHGVPGMRWHAHRLGVLGFDRRQGLCCAELAKRSAPTLMSHSPVRRAWPISCSPVFSAALAGNTFAF